MLLFEHFGWFEAPLHLTAFGACVLCVISAIMFLAKGGRLQNDATIAGLPPRKLAYVALVPAGGFLFLFAGVCILLTFMPSGF